MPYSWTRSADENTLVLWPHQSMTPKGFTWFIGATSFMLALPLLALLGSAVVWVLIGFFFATITAVWYAITSNQKSRSTLEHLRLTDTRVDIEHRPPVGAPLVWEANPHWVTVNLRDDGPVEKYLTLRGGGREVELGRFLTPEERQALYGELVTLLRR